MSLAYIREYQAEYDKLRRVSGTANESTVRRAFENCLQKYCKTKGLTLVAELAFASASGKVYPDGTVVDALRMPWGYWEAKDAGDDIDAAIESKTRQGYPTNNIIYENTAAAVLIQNGEEVLRVGMRDNAALDRLIRAFLKHEPAEIENFRKAIAQFKLDLPDVLRALREAIEQSHAAKPAFRATADAFLALCQTAINPAVEAADVREMLIQHILTRDIFLKVFDEDQFHRENNIARRLDELADSFFTGATRRATVDRLRGYYRAMTTAAAAVAGHAEKQKFLKAVYEDFYKIYNPRAADRLGVVYTPNEIVDFMLRAADELVNRHFGRRLCDKNVHILDPAAGTGTYITDLINHEALIPAANLRYKYENEIYANEVGILPYYIANLNIEYTYKNRMGEYREFPNICFVDTLDNLSFAGRKGQDDLIGAMTHENMQRVKNQNAQQISVIIGNPPYNANQRNENDNNKNREYPGVDARIKQTYIAASTAQKTKQYDMYKRFIRWASDRLGKRGVLAFITNRAYIDKRQDDGFRKIVVNEFDEIYIVDLGGDLRKQKEAGAVNNPNVFGIMTGVAIGFFVRHGGGRRQRGGEIHFTRRGNDESAADKLAFLANARFEDIHFARIAPDHKHNWLNQTDNDFDALLCVADKATKLAKSTAQEKALFKLFAMAVGTNRDEWVYDFDRKNLVKKVKFFANTYNRLIETDDESFPTTIKWSRDLKNEFKRGKQIVVQPKTIIKSIYRPFSARFHFPNFVMNDVLTKNHHEIFGVDLNRKNMVICVNRNGNKFYALACNMLPDLHFTGDSQCLPLYRYDQNGNRHSNLTAWGLQQFRDHYNNRKITAEEIFHYTYAVLHNPAYRAKYAVNLRREFPRLAFYADFDAWARLGKKLMDLHLNFAKAPPYQLRRADKPCDPGAAKLRADKPRGKIIIDEATELAGLPNAAWDYQLGARSALEWVLDQYKEKKPRDPTVRAKFNAYRLADHKQQVIELLARVCTVSVETMKIIDEMNRLADADE